MKNKLYKTITDSINAYLKLDPHSKKRLSELKGKTIAIQLLPFNFQFQLTCHQDSIMLNHEDSLIKPDAKVSGTALQLINVAISKKDRHRFFAEDIEIEGDAVIGQKIIALFDEMDIDWEDKLSNFIGDVSAHHVGNILRNIKGWLSSSEQSMTKNLSEYLQEEKNLFPSKEALSDFYHDIDHLNLDVERIEAKINDLKNQLSL